MAINFPTSPTTNYIHSENNLSWKFNGTSWVALPTPSVAGNVAYTPWIGSVSNVQTELSAITGVTSVVGFGANAVTNGTILDTAISDINTAGGGKLIIPAGEWDITPIGTQHVLTKDLNIHFETGAVLTSSAGSNNNIFDLIGQSSENVSVLFDGQGTIDVSANAYTVAIDIQCIKVSNCDTVDISGINFIGGEYYLNSFDWEANIDYKVGLYIQSENDVYLCIVAHTSTDFDTDLSSGNWELVTAAVGKAYVGGDESIAAINNVHSTIRNCTFKGFRGRGVEWGEGGHFTIDSCSFYNCRSGVTGRGDGQHGVISNSYFEGGRYGLTSIGEGDEGVSPKSVTVDACKFVRVWTPMVIRFQTHLIATNNSINDFGYAELGISDLATTAGAIQIEGASYSIISNNFFKQNEETDTADQICIRVANRTDSENVLWNGGRLSGSNNVFDVNNALWYSEVAPLVWPSLITDSVCYGGNIGNGIIGTTFHRRTNGDSDSQRFYSNKSSGLAEMTSRYYESVAVYTNATAGFLMSEIQYGRSFKMTASGTKTLTLHDTPSVGFHFFVYFTADTVDLTPSNAAHQIATAQTLGAAGATRTISNLFKRYRVEYVGDDTWITT